MPSYYRYAPGVYDWGSQALTRGITQAGSTIGSAITGRKQEAKREENKRAVLDAYQKLYESDQDFQEVFGDVEPMDVGYAGSKALIEGFMLKGQVQGYKKGALDMDIARQQKDVVAHNLKAAQMEMGRAEKGDYALGYAMRQPGTPESPEVMEMSRAERYASVGGADPKVIDMFMDDDRRGHVPGTMVGPGGTMLYEQTPGTWQQFHQASTTDKLPDTTKEARYLNAQVVDMMGQQVSQTALGGVTLADYINQTYNPDGSVKAGAEVNPAAEQMIDRMEVIRQRISEYEGTKYVPGVARRQQQYAPPDVNSDAVAREAAGTPDVSGAIPNFIFQDLNTPGAR